MNHNDVLGQLTNTAGLDADNPHIFANIDNMGLIAGTFDTGKLRQLLDARLQVLKLQRTSLTAGAIIKALELQLLNTSYASLFHSGQSLTHTKDYFFFTPFINLLDDIPADYADLTPANISSVLEEISSSEPDKLFCACAAAVTRGIHKPVEAVYLDSLICGIPASKVGKAAALLAAQDAMMMRVMEEGNIDEQSFIWDMPSESSYQFVSDKQGQDATFTQYKSTLEQAFTDSKVVLDKDSQAVTFNSNELDSGLFTGKVQQVSKHAEEQGHTLAEQGLEQDKYMVNSISTKAPFVGLVMNVNTWKNTVTPLLSSNQLLICESSSRLPLWSQSLPSGIDKNSAQAIALVDWHTLRTYFKCLKYVITGTGACTAENFRRLANEDLFMIAHLPEKHPLFAHLLDNYVSGKSLKALTERYSYGTGYTSFASDQHYHEHNRQQQLNLINQQENRQYRLLVQQKQRTKNLLGTMLPECSFEGQRVKALLVYNLNHQEARRKFYIKIAQAERQKYQFKADNLNLQLYASLDLAHKAINEVNTSLRFCSLQNIEFKGDVKGIRLVVELKLDQDKIVRQIKRDCSMIILTNDTARNWEADELWLMFQRLRSQHHAPELTLQNVLPVDPFYLSSRAAHQGLMFVLSLGLLLHKATELQLRGAMEREGLALPAFKDSLQSDSRPSLFKFNNYLREVGPSPALEYHIHSNKISLTPLPPAFKAIVDAMGEEWSKYYYADAYHAQDYNGEMRL